MKVGSGVNGDPTEDDRQLQKNAERNLGVRHPVFLCERRGGVEDPDTPSDQASGGGGPREGNEVILGADTYGEGKPFPRPRCRLLDGQAKSVGVSLLVAHSR